MNSNSVKRLIEKHFGPMHESLTIGNIDEKHDNVYFYSLENEEEIVALTELLETQNITGGLKMIPELDQSFSIQNDELPQCVCYSESDGVWHMFLYHITGVKYHRTPENHIVSTLQHKYYPSIRLSSMFEGECDGFWHKSKREKHAPYMDTDMISYWMNRELRYNLSFRTFAVDYINAEAERMHHYILKDVA